MVPIFVLICSYIIAVSGFIVDHIKVRRHTKLGVILIVIATIGAAFGVNKELSDEKDKVKRNQAQVKQIKVLNEVKQDQEKQIYTLNEVKLELNEKLNEEKITRDLLRSKLDKINENIGRLEKEAPPDIASRLREIEKEVRGLIDFKNGYAVSGIIQDWSISSDGTEAIFSITPGVEIVNEITIDTLKDILDKNKDKISNYKESQIIDARTIKVFFTAPSYLFAKELAEIKVPVVSGGR